MQAQSVIDQGFGIYTIDTGYGRPGLVASHLLRQGDRYAFIDVGTSSCLPAIRKTLADMDVSAEQIRYIVVTHVHLDHAGAAGVLMQECPDAQLVVHPRGARHMVDPTRLIAGASAVYGEERLKKTFGDIVPVAADRVIEAHDEMLLDLGGRELLFLDTPGHARHHFCVYDASSQAFFSGDTFGLSYAPLRSRDQSFVFPTTTPVQFDPLALHRSIDRLMSYHPERMFMTHFGCLPDPAPAASQLHQFIDEYVNMALAVNTNVEDCVSDLVQLLKDNLLAKLADAGCQLSVEQIMELVAMDLTLNAQGLCYWLQQQSGQ